MTSASNSYTAELTPEAMEALAAAYENDDVVFLTPAKSKTIAAALRAYARGNSRPEGCKFPHCLCPPAPVACLAPYRSTPPQEAK